jgi:hypothetical protein
MNRTDDLQIVMGKDDFGQDYHINLRIQQCREAYGFFRLYKLSDNGTGEYEKCDLQVKLKFTNAQYYLQDEHNDRQIPKISLKYSATAMATPEDPAQMDFNLTDDYYGNSILQVYDNRVIHVFREWVDYMHSTHNLLVTIEVPDIPHLSQLRRREEGIRRCRCRFAV